ncbi:MAG TPA: patatin-like phospholipase family protein [Gammaproteobacteria bacterium]
MHSGVEQAGKNTKPARIGVALSSGGGRGVFAHTGFLLALEKLGIDVAAIAGCSAGALVGGIYASGTDLHRWSKRIIEARTREYWSPDSWPRLYWNMIVRKGRGYNGLSDTLAALGFIQENLTAKSFEECKIPFYCLALNLSKNSKEIFSEGDLAPRIMASAAMPVLYRPVLIGGEWYSDGATIELAPTEAICCKHKLDALVVHHAAGHRKGSGALAWTQKQPWSLLQLLNLLLYRQRPWYLSEQPLTFHRCPGGCGAPIIVIEPDLPELTWPLNTGGAEIQNTSMIQALSLLQAFADQLKTNPDKLFSSFPETISEPPLHGVKCNGK